MTSVTPATDEPLHLVHAIPGRVRARWRPLRSLDAAQRDVLARELRALPGVLSLEVSSRTGSIVIGYDHEILTKGEVVGRVVRATGARLAAEDEERPVRPASGQPRVGSKLGIEMAAFFEGLNDDVLRATEGHADLATLMPLAFVGLGTVEVAVSRELPAPPWWSLFWWSFRSFLSLNAPAIKTAVENGHHRDMELE